MLCAGGDGQDGYFDSMGDNQLFNSIGFVLGECGLVII